LNIFILDTDPKKAAEYHCDKHVVKMILESCQMLSTAHWIKLLENNGKNIADFKKMKILKEYLYENTDKKLQPPYKLTHHRHPCTIWTHQTKQNYEWHLSLLYHLCKEYTLRYKKTHKSEQYYKWFKDNLPVNIDNDKLQQFPICMKEEYKISKDPVVCYKFYYIFDKSRFAKWKYTKIPVWYKKGLEKLENENRINS
jgi:hypothetical protein